jgi:hypothetical protein
VTFAFSRALAIVVAVVTVLSEVGRRRQRLFDPDAILLWIDDFVLAAFLLYGAWRAGANGEAGRPSLAAAWGFMCGLSFFGFFEQMQRLAGLDPAALAPTWVVVMKAGLLVLGMVGLAAALRGREPRAGVASGDDSRPAWPGT